MAKTYKLVTTLSDGTEIDAGTFEVPDASGGGTTFYQHNVIIVFSHNSETLEGGGFTFSFISTSSTKLSTWNELYSRLKYASIGSGYFGSYDGDKTWILYAISGTHSDVECIDLRYNINDERYTQAYAYESDIGSYTDYVSEIT